MFDHILVPTDGSDTANNAVQRGVELAAEHGATVHAMSVVEPVPLGKFTAGPEPASAGHGEVLEEQRAEAQVAIDYVVDRGTEHEVEVVERLQHGKPVEEILDYAEDEPIDVIVMGTHGRSGTERFIIGSVAEKVVRQSPVPVLTVRNES
jgi:nucleotide-binding universal stress UspA family protein